MLKHSHFLIDKDKNIINIDIYIYFFYSESIKAVLVDQPWPVAGVGAELHVSGFSSGRGGDSSEGGGAVMKRRSSWSRFSLSQRFFSLFHMKSSDGQTRTGSNRVKIRLNLD